MFIWFHILFDLYIETFESDVDLDFDIDLDLNTDLIMTLTVDADVRTSEIK